VKVEGRLGQEKNFISGNSYFVKSVILLINYYMKKDNKVRLGEKKMW